VSGLCFFFFLVFFAHVIQKAAFRIYCVIYIYCVV
jgi:hypothetical protein